MLGMTLIETAAKKINWMRKKLTGCEKRLEPCSAKKWQEDRSKNIQKNGAWIRHVGVGRGSNASAGACSSRIGFCTMRRNVLEGWKQRKCMETWSVSMAHVPHRCKVQMTAER